jgi:transposase
MRAVDSFLTIYLHRAPVDFRKQSHGLSVIVEEEMGVSPFAEALFVFASRDRKKLKILYWDRSGFALWSKKLEKEKFPWPKKFEEAVVRVGPRELSWLLDGYEFWKMKPHEELCYASVS